jgi:pimeloyl-ACP methyl ester carboxylesterase
MAVSGAAFAWEQLDSVRTSATQVVGAARYRYRKVIRDHRDVAMVPGSILVDGLRLNYAISDNEGDADQVVAVNIHGYFAGGEMYARESQHLAEGLGWRVVNPSLPGFGGSEPLSWSQISMVSLADRVEALLDHLAIDRAVIIGHSMGGGVAMEFAARHPERVLGVVYRAGVATPAWHDRHGIIPLAMSSVAPDVGPLADLVAAVALDIPDLLVGRMLSTIRSLLPDLRRNLKTLARTAPVASMLMEVDQTAQVASVIRDGVPVLAEWGCFDRLINAATAAQFAEITGVAIQWVPGGHSWMLARPAGQRDILRHLPSGKAFVADVALRSQQLQPAPRRLRAL